MSCMTLIDDPNVLNLNLQTVVTSMLQLHR